MKLKHTQGPWERMTLPNEEQGIVGNGEIICQLIHDNESNARLIAAAVELLYAAKEINQYFSQFPESYLSENMLRLWTLIQNAIDKSEGNPS